MFSAMDPQLFQSDGQVVDTDASVSVDIQDLEEHLEPMLLLGSAAHRTVIRGVAGLIMAVLGWRCRAAQSPTTNTAASPSTGVRALILRAALAENTAKQRRHEWSPRMHVTELKLTLFKIKSVCVWARGEREPRDRSGDSFPVKMRDRWALR